MPTTLAINWNSDENFWTLNPMLKTIKAFKNLYTKDKSKGKAQSSKLMWAIALCVDPNEANPYRNQNIDERQALVATDYLNDSEFNWDHKEIQELMDTYKDFCITVAERDLIALETKLRQRSIFLEKTDYTLDETEDNRTIKGTADQLDKMLLNTSKISAQVEEIKARIAKENASSKLRGGASESLTEQGLI